jgi:hypothetical protein
MISAMQSTIRAFSNNLSTLIDYLTLEAKPYFQKSKCFGSKPTRGSMNTLGQSSNSYAWQVTLK